MSDAHDLDLIESETLAISNSFLEEGTLVEEGDLLEDTDLAEAAALAELAGEEDGPVEDADQVVDDVALLDDDEDLLDDDEDRTFPDRPCGDPAAHDRLLKALRRSHPEGHDRVEDTGAPRSRARPPQRDISFMGSSAGLCADAA